MAEVASDPAVKKKGERLQSYQAFWPHYLKEHSKDKTRYLHYLGSSLAIGALASAAFTKNPKLLLAIPVAGYGPAWVGHFFVEHNKPATFEYPLWSLFSDFKMYFLWLSGKLEEELEKHEAAAKAA